jgi:membrane fusion protein (multidrug efflux system)
METNVMEKESEPKASQSQTASPALAAAAPEAKKPGLWSKPAFRFTVFIGGVVVIAALAFFYWYSQGRVNTDDAEVDGHLDPVSAKISGNVLQVLVDDNQQVKAGQILVTIDPRDYQAKVDQMRAALDLAKAQSNAANVTVPKTMEVRTGENSNANAALQGAVADEASANQTYQMALTSDLAYANSQVVKYQASFDKAQADLARMKPLVEKAEISRQQFDSFVAAAQVAQGDLDAAKQRLAQAQQNVTVAKAKLDSKTADVGKARAGQVQANGNLKQVNIDAANAVAASASVKQAEANLAAAELQLSYATIVAPVDGVVTHKSVEVGEVLQPGQGLLILVPLQDIWVTADFKETQLAKVRKGQKVEVKVDMYGQTFSGRVDSVAGATGSRMSLLPPENATGNFVKVVERIPVKIILDPIPPDKAILRPGMNVDVTIITRQ